MKLILGADHAGFGLKDALKQSLILSGHDVVDVGADEFDEADDYPDFVAPMVEELTKGNPSEPEGLPFGGEVMGIFCAGSGEGEAIALNRHKGIRATVYYHHDPQILRLTREHNNSNVLCIGTRFVSAEDAKEAVEMWLSIPFDPTSRHARRLAKIDNLIPST